MINSYHITQLLRYSNNFYCIAMRRLYIVVLYAYNIISINVGISDMMVENISWNKNEVPKLYSDKVHELMCYLYTYLVNSGFRGQFIESTTLTLNMLPMYMACDAARQNKLTIEQTRQHSKKNWH